MPVTVKNQLFHFTKTDRLINILDKNILKAGNNRYVCFTRDKNYLYINDKFGMDCALVVDRENLRADYSLILTCGWHRNSEFLKKNPQKMYRWYKKLHGEREPANLMIMYKRYQHTHQITASPDSIGKTVTNHGRESEERIESDVCNMKKYLTEIILSKEETVDIFLSYAKTNKVLLSLAEFNYNQVWYPRRDIIYSPC